MEGQARVGSIDALESFRASLIVFIERARAAVEEAADEVRRARQWVHQDRRVYWDHQVRVRRRACDEADQALMAARISDLRTAKAAEQMAALKAKRALAEAEEKLVNVRKWSRDFDERFTPLLKGLEGMRQLLAEHLPEGARALAQLERSLVAYTELRAPAESPPPPATRAANPEVDP